MARSVGNGEKRYRSMQEHIRRAHPDYYIPKLPATEESFQLMISTPPSQRPQQPTAAPAPARKGLYNQTADASEQAPLLEQVGAVTGPPSGTANAAVALAQLHNWDSEFDVFPESDYKREGSGGFELPSLRAQFSEDTLPPFQTSRTRELLPSILQSPGSRYSSLPPLQRRDKMQRSKKSSMGQNARKGKHERGKSREFSAKDFTRRLSVEGRKAMSAEPPTAAWVQGKRWEDLIEAATTATEVDDDRDLTPMPQSPNFPPSQGSTAMAMHAQTAAARRLSAADTPGGGDGAYKRSSLPPGFRPLGHHLQHGSAGKYSYNASPLQRALTPPPPDVLGANDSEPFPSVETVESAGSGANFHISASGLPTSNDTSPLQHYSEAHPYRHSQSSSFGSKSEVLEIYCASCGRPWLLKNSFACTECICGVCSDCVGQIISSPVMAVQPGLAPMRRGCPRCGVMGGKWKRFQLDFR
ncbi:hypothetical protein PV08_06427 [Exophiala spinifera]|uniref:RING zinc finger-like domain-containing protein n=1 Tax=Exophiala spinifera TaxID=91928 RepID=A0A0D1YMV0_9EURO|nr:uncharacterized protein PV08_06427 [Exophiala spinifera]KIW16376.1 hypothetical protein PV08_06427 [Exophiala spinifera]